MQAGPAVAAPAVVRALRAFVAAHGGAGTAVVEHLGRSRARVVVVAADGTWGDQVVTGVGPGTDAARAACDAAGIPVVDGWDRELSAAVRPSPAGWARMARTPTRR